MAAKSNLAWKAPSPERRESEENPAHSTPQKAVGLDQLIHERVRLGIVSALAAVEKLTFAELKEILGLTDGNLSIHARKLEDAKYVAVHKFFEGRKPQTEFRLTAAGRKAFEKYLNHMEALIQASRARD